MLGKNICLRKFEGELRDGDKVTFDDFTKDGAKIGTVLRIRLPADYIVTDGPRLHLVAPAPAPSAFVDPKLSATAVAALGAAAVIAKNPVVSRRFWKR